MYKNKNTLLRDTASLIRLQKNNLTLIRPMWTSSQFVMPLCLFVEFQSPELRKMLEAPVMH